MGGFKIVMEGLEGMMAILVATTNRDHDNNTRSYNES